MDRVPLLLTHFYIIHEKKKKHRRCDGGLNIVCSLAKEFALNRPFRRFFQLLTGTSWPKSIKTAGKTCNQ